MADNEDKKGFSGLDELLTNLESRNRKPKEKETKKVSNESAPQPSSSTARPRPQQRTTTQSSSTPNQSSNGGKIFAVLAVAGLFVLILVYAQSSGNKSKKQASAHPNYPPQQTKTYQPTPTWSDYHVTANTLNVREAASTKSRVVGKLSKYDTVRIPDSQTDSGWVRVKLGGLEGYVTSRYLSKGSGKAAIEAECRQNITRPYNGSKLTRSRTGPHSVTIKNSNYSDAIVKFKNYSGDTVVSFYVRQNSQTTISDMPEGSYKLCYATGNNYSSRCDRFMDDMSASCSDTYDSFKTTSDNYYEYTTTAEYTLYKVRDGNMRTVNIPSSQF